MSQEGTILRLRGGIIVDREGNSEKEKNWKPGVKSFLKGPRLKRRFTKKRSPGKERISLAKRG